MCGSSGIYVRARVDTRASLTCQFSLTVPRRTPEPLGTLVFPVTSLGGGTNKLLPALVVPVEIMLATSISWTIVFALVALMGCPERSHESP